MRSTSSPRAVSMMIGVCDCARTLRQRLRPSSPGSMTSRIRRSTRWSVMARDHLAAVGRGRDVAGVVAQVFCDQRPRLAIVFNDKDVGYCLGHADLLSVIRAHARRIFVSGCFWMTSGQYRATGEGAGEKTSLRSASPTVDASSTRTSMNRLTILSDPSPILGAIMTSISAASAQTYQSPLQKLQDELLSEVKSGAISSSDQDALASALTDIDSAMQASRASDQASGTRPSPGDLKSKIDDLIAGEVSSGKLTSDQATELQGIFKAAFANGPGGAGRCGGARPGGGPAVRRPPMARPPATTLRRARRRSTTSSSSSCNRCRNRCRLRHRRATARPAASSTSSSAFASRHC